MKPLIPSYLLNNDTILFYQMRCFYHIPIRISINIKHNYLILNDYDWKIFLKNLFLFCGACFLLFCFWGCFGGKAGCHVLTCSLLEHSSSLSPRQAWQKQLFCRTINLPCPTFLKWWRDIVPGTAWVEAVNSSWGISSWVKRMISAFADSAAWTKSATLRTMHWLEFTFLATMFFTMPPRESHSDFPWWAPKYILSIRLGVDFISILKCFLFL